MTADRTPPERHRDVFAALSGFASLVFAASLSSGPLIGLAVAGGAAAFCLALYAPTALVLAWIGTGPTLSTWLDVRVGPLPALTPDRALLMLLLFVSAWRWLRRPWTLLPLGRFEQLMAWFLLYAAASAVLGGGSQETNLAATKSSAGGLRQDLVALAIGYGLPFLSFFLTKNLLYRDSHIRWLLGTFVAVGVFVAVTGILQRFAGITIFTPSRMSVIHEGRATGTMASASEFGMIVGAPLLAAIVCVLRSRYMPERLLLAGAISIMAVSIVLARTRAIWLGIVVGLVIAALYEPALRKRLAGAALVPALALAVAWPLIADSEFIRNRVMDMTPIHSRIVTTATALNMFVHSPLFGFGFGRYTYDSEKWDYIVGAFGLTSYHAYGPGVPHNEFMHVLILLGLIGFVPYLAILVLAWRTAVRHYRERAGLSGPCRDIALIFLAAFGLYLTTACTIDALFFGYPSIQVYSLLGALDGLRARES
jgi:O-antigen ligase